MRVTANNTAARTTIGFIFNILLEPPYVSFVRVEVLSFHTYGGGQANMYKFLNLIKIKGKCIIFSLINQNSLC
ncbi:hypothetical protein J27TS8_30230 [Robertmurraya siralis]|uniref:Uncharacterized protein n=1 Tax=Robertmurraya siralis TaxID=77777 RepID=A0A919WJ73_9BACI|nr:hypothetical protein J27TS8_30230 [Robertmurraya siralis]